MLITKNKKIFRKFYCKTCVVITYTENKVRKLVTMECQEQKSQADDEGEVIGDSSHIISSVSRLVNKKYVTHENGFTFKNLDIFITYYLDQKLAAFFKYFL